MIKNLLFLILLGLCVEVVKADSFSDAMATFKSSVNGKVSSFETSFNTKMDTFKSSVSTKFSSWEKNYSTYMNTFESSVKSKCDSFSTNINNKLSSFEKEVRTKSAGTSSADFTAKVDSFKSDVQSGFSNLSSSVKDDLSSFNKNLQNEFGATDYAQIADDYNTLASGIQEDYESNLADTIADNGELDEALDNVAEEAENQYTSANQTVLRGWKPRSVPYAGWWQLFFGPGSWKVGGSAHSTNSWAYDEGGSHVLAGPAVGGGTVFTCTTSGYLWLASSSLPDNYLYPSTQADPGGGTGLDSDGDSVTDDDEVNAGTDPNDANDHPSTGAEPESEEEQTLEEISEGKLDVGFETGIEALDLIIKKLSPDFSSLVPSGQDDYSLTIPIVFSPYIDMEITIGNFDTLLDGKIAWLRSIVRGFSKIAMVWVFLFSVIVSLRQW